MCSSLVDWFWARGAQPALSEAEPRTEIGCRQSINCDDGGCRLHPVQRALRQWGCVAVAADDGMKFACLALEKDGLAVHCIAVVETWQLQPGAGPVFNQLAVRTS